MKVGIVGLGVMGNNHVRVLNQMPQVKKVLVYDISPELNAIGEKNEMVGSLEELASAAPDYVVVALPTIFHSEAAIFLASRRIPTLLEKPVAPSQTESESIALAFSEAETICAVGHVERFNPSLSALRQKIAEGVIGKPLQISTRRVGPFPSRVNDVGVILDLASHDIDLVGWITGQDYKSLSSHTASPLPGHHEDMFLAIGELMDSTLVSHEVNWVTPTKARQTSVLGEDGMLVADSLRAELRLFRNGAIGSDWGMYSNYRGVTEGEEIKFVVPVREPLLQEHEAMMRELAHPGSTEICSIEEGLRVMRVLTGLLND
jgi:predicted dehydrogenase